MLPRTAAAMRPRPGGDPVVYATKMALRTLGRRALALEAEKRQLKLLLRRLVAEQSADLLSLYGVGVDTAAALLVAAGDNPDRLRSEASWARRCGVAPIEASSGKVTRLRLSKGGNRQANAALWHIVTTRMVSDPRTREYVARRSKEGQEQTRDHPGPQALRRPRGLPLPPTPITRDLAAGLTREPADTPGCP
jgi:transposase